MISQMASNARWALLSFRRNPAGTFFTIIFPILFLFVFGAVFGNETTDAGAKVATFIVPGILTLSIVSATFLNIAMGQVIRRESGQLKRLRGTPLRPLVYVGGQIIASFVIVAFMTVLVTVIGRLFFGVVFNWNTLGVFIPTIVLGSFVFAALGFAVTAIIPNDDAAPAITNAIVLPLYFVSDVFFFSDEDSTGFFTKIGDYFPVKRMSNSLQDSYNPFVESATVPWTNWAVMAAWGIFGVIVATKFMRWTPQTERR